MTDIVEITPVTVAEVERRARALRAEAAREMIRGLGRALRRMALSATGAGRKAAQA
ncbi:MAG: hypothetical protein NXH83_16295 [Rhodobacteraceae bacterium]|nr:hypothetical protein [Paracoccaceae bacterium]